DAGPRSGAELLLQHDPRHRRGPLDAAAAHAIDHRAPVVLFRLGDGADRAVQLAGLALGHRPVPARGGALPRGGARGHAAVGAADAARRGDPRDRRAGAGLLSAAAGSALLLRPAAPARSGPAGWPDPL